MKVYEKVRAYIDKMQFEQGFVAKKSGISYSNFKAIMNGKKTMYADELCAICIALNVSPEIFIDNVKPDCSHENNAEILNIHKTI
jgi:transcriptional regulator with XRE-family HTH domain